MNRSFKFFLIPFLFISTTSFAKSACVLERFVYQTKFQNKLAPTNLETYEPISTEMKLTSRFLHAIDTLDDINTEEECFISAIYKSPKTAKDYTRWTFSYPSGAKTVGEVDYMLDKENVVEGTNLALHQACLFYFAEKNGKPKNMTPHRVMIGYNIKPKKNKTPLIDFEPASSPSRPVENSSETFTVFPPSDEVQSEYEAINIYSDTAFGMVNFIPAVVIGKTNEDTAKACSTLAKLTLDNYYKDNHTKEYTKIHWEVEHPFARNHSGWVPSE